jgi:TonB family protein
MTVVSPTGTFSRAFDTGHPLAAWADSLERLFLSTHAASAGATAEPVQLTELPAPPSRFDLTEFHFGRDGGGSPARHNLFGTNGAWGFALRMDTAQAAALLAALRGRQRSGVARFDLPRIGRTNAESSPDVDGAWLDYALDQSAKLLPESMKLSYPTALAGTGIVGSVRLSFIVDSTGRARPSSVRLIGKAHPVLAFAARDALLAASFVAGRREGRAVSQRVMQEFTFDP